MVTITQADSVSMFQAVYHCSHWAYSRTSGLCYLRQGDREVPMAGYVSGPKFCPRQPASDQAPGGCSPGLCLQVWVMSVCDESHYYPGVRGDDFITREMFWSRENPCVTTTGA